MSLPTVLHDILSLPTAAFVEAAVYEYLEAACRRMPGVRIRYDRYGNLLARYRHDPPSRTPVAFVAHTDHPGFIVTAAAGRERFRAEFRGGVQPEYFPDARVRLWSDGRWIKARVCEITKRHPRPAPGVPPRVKEVLLEAAKPVPVGSIGMWDLPEPRLRGDHVMARACDDLAGVAAILALLERLSQSGARADVYALFTRAEEVGFVGASGAIRARTIPKRVPVLSIETSSTLPHAPIGAGPIVRVGDRASVFTPTVVASCCRVAQGLAARRPGFAYQRKLMDGGMCEATAFLVHGYAAAGICLALGNYHNMNTRRRKIDSEYVSLRDWQGLVDLFEAVAVDEWGLNAADQDLRNRVDRPFHEGEAKLLADGR